MTSFLSKIKPTSQSIQKEYVQKRQRALYANDPEKTARVKAKIEQLMNIFKVGGDWYDHYLKIHKGLQNSHLTINIEAASWFLNENTYEAYAQMYERAVGADKKMNLTDNDPKNPALARAIADDLVTIPDEWANSHPFSQRKRLHNALNVTGATRESLKMHGANSLKATPKMSGAAGTGYTTSNKDFKAKAKQVFAALNYGIRPHGSNTLYGFSYLVLNPGLKENALYYPQDTFYLAGSGTRSQATFNTIGALLEFASTTSADGIGQQIWKSCHDYIPLPDTKDPGLLLEGHIFKKLKLAEDVQSLVLSRQAREKDQPLTSAQWDVIVKNAMKWCQRNGIRLTYASP